MEEIHEDQPKRQKGLQKDLESKNEKRIIEALERIPAEGTAALTPSLLGLFKEPLGPEATALHLKIVHNLKDPAVMDHIAAALRQDEFRAHRRELLELIWQSGLNMSHEVGLFIDIALTEDYVVGIEVMTIIDFLEDFPDEALSENIRKLDMALKRKSDKTALLENIRQILLDKLLDE